MCYLVVERYSVCRCIYYQHNVDMCGAHGYCGHSIEERTVLVGYSCERHDESQEKASSMSILPTTTDASGNGRKNKHISGSRSKKTKKGDAPLRTLYKPSLESQTTPEPIPTSKRGNITNNLRDSIEVGKSTTTLGKEEVAFILDHENYASDSSRAPSEIWTESDGTADSTSTIPRVEIASAELVSLIAEHDRLKNLYKPLITALGHIATGEALVAVLKSYAKSLKVDSSQPQEHKAGELVRSHARRISYACVAFHDPRAPAIDLDERWEALHRQKVQASTRVEDYLNNVASRELPEQDSQNDLDELSDDSDREDIEDPLPNLGKVKAFMTSGPPFDQLYADISHLLHENRDRKGATFVELTKSDAAKTTAKNSQTIDEKCDILEPDSLHGCPNQIPQETNDRRQVSSPAMYKYHQVFLPWLKSKFWSSMRPESTRLSWTCDCGSMLYEDYATTNPETINKLSQLIERPVNITTTTSAGSAPSNIRPPCTSTPSSNIPLPKIPTHEDFEGKAVHNCQVLNGSCKTCFKRMTRKFLALCVNTGRFHKTLGEIEVTDICRDSEAFSRIRSRYLEVRGFRARARKLFLLRASKVNFVKINVEDTFRADIIETPSIPPLTEVHLKHYEYSPLDLPLPPITSNSFLHYLENPDCESLKRTKRWLSCLPKRLEEQLLSRRISSEPDIIVSGWGIHIEETLNEEGVSILAFVILSASAIIGVIYSAMMGDASGGFTIAGYIATTLGVFVTVVYFRWQQE
ncbi:hypothetical protein HYFRA_00004293 [Hymenoscyphus fraxineus]|uniref:Uncharacterized protein n=1 Tax=Hymenoscyphus fraxineus TaxID=746836 RepID=A0A9N9KMU2_9HELO|nr:hypothetical protein HYFRA_00004293 [Hymenoscyphus fraxineus]